MTKPTTALHWADSPTTLRTEPSEPTKNTGFAVNAKLPAQFFNWISGTCGDWITWLNTRLFDEYTLTTTGEDCRLYGDGTNGLEVRNAAADRMPVAASQAWLGPAGEVHLEHDSGALSVQDNGGDDADLWAKSIRGADYKLDADYDSTIGVPLGTGLSTDVGATGWTRAAGAAPDFWISAVATSSLTFDVQVPEGAKVSYVAVDWQPHAASPATPMRFSAQKRVNTPGANGDGASETCEELLSTTYVNQQASTSRKWAVMTPDQNNTGFQCASGVTWVRVRIEASSDAADFVYGVYLIVTHRSVGHLGAAPVVS